MDTVKIKEYKGDSYVSEYDKTGGCKNCVAVNDSKLCNALSERSSSKLWCDDMPWKKAEAVAKPEATQLPGTKYDDGKLDYTLVPPLALEAVARNLTEGLKKYHERDNWKKVPEAKERYLKALYRHLEAHRRGDIYDTESSVPDMLHIAAVAVNAMFILEFMLDEKLTQPTE